jgi:hypothetical protein
VSHANVGKNLVSGADLRLSPRSVALLFASNSCDRSTLHRLARVTTETMSSELAIIRESLDISLLKAHRIGLLATLLTRRRSKLLIRTMNIGASTKNMIKESITSLMGTTIGDSWSLGADMLAIRSKATGIALVKSLGANAVWLVARRAKRLSKSLVPEATVSARNMRLFFDRSWAWIVDPNANTESDESKEPGSRSQWHIPMVIQMADEECVQLVACEKQTLDNQRSNRRKRPAEKSPCAKEHEKEREVGAKQVQRGDGRIKIGILDHDKIRRDVLGLG